ncbi:hypothetical protein F53441_10102 [Fusarium austroafricanum]|uniref:Uncharacterized protein n=1 Tax=Fusarium austroafricanum TaxID=2364996 RepID=A0A8H4K9G0_9HYPO|nr:hypothetical protein F53441_10102 [Fusarium austroafricanum]
MGKKKSKKRHVSTAHTDEPKPKPGRPSKADQISKVPANARVQAERMRSQHPKLQCKGEAEWIAATSDLIPCDEDDERAFSKEWDESVAKVSSNRKFQRAKDQALVHLWRICLRLCRPTTPVLLISPYYSLRYQNMSNNNFTDEVIFSESFCSELASLMAHPIWEENVNNLIWAIHWTIICRIDDRRDWSNDPRLCPALEIFYADLESCDRPLPKSYHDMHTAARDRVIQSGRLPSEWSNLLHMIGQTVSMKARRPSSKASYLTHGDFPILPVTTWDLQALTEAVDATSLRPAWNYSVSDAWDAWKALKEGNEVPSNKDLPLLYKLSYKDLFRQFRALNCPTVLQSNRDPESGDSDEDLEDDAPRQSSSSEDLESEPDTAAAGAISSRYNHDEMANEEVDDDLDSNNGDMFDDNLFFPDDGQNHDMPETVVGHSDSDEEPLTAVRRRPRASPSVVRPFGPNLSHPNSPITYKPTLTTLTMGQREQQRKAAATPARESSSKRLNQGSPQETRYERALTQARILLEARPYVDKDHVANHIRQLPIAEGPPSVTQAIDAEWLQSPEMAASRRFTTKGHAALLTLWKTCARVLSTSPVMLISPLQHLRYQETDSSGKANDTIYSPKFCNALTVLIVHRYFAGKSEKLVRALQYAVACRIDDRAVWPHEHYRGGRSKALGLLSEELGDTEAQSPIHTMHASIRRRLGREGNRLGSRSDLLYHIGETVRARKTRRPPVIKKFRSYHGVPVLPLTIWDLNAIVQAVDTMEWSPQRIEYYGYSTNDGWTAWKEAKKGNSEGPSREQLPQMYEICYKDLFRELRSRQGASNPTNPDVDPGASERDADEMEDDGDRQESNTRQSSSHESSDEDYDDLESFHGFFDPPATSLQSSDDEMPASGGIFEDAGDLNSAGSPPIAESPNSFRGHDQTTTAETHAIERLKQEIRGFKDKVAIMQSTIDQLAQNSPPGRAVSLELGQLSDADNSRIQALEDKNEELFIQREGLQRVNEHLIEMLGREQARVRSLKAEVIDLKSSAVQNAQTAPGPTFAGTLVSSQPSLRGDHTQVDGDYRRVEGHQNNGDGAADFADGVNRQNEPRHGRSPSLELVGERPVQEEPLPMEEDSVPKGVAPFKRNPEVIISPPQQPLTERLFGSRIGNALVRLRLNSMVRNEFKPPKSIWLSETCNMKE